MLRKPRACRVVFDGQSRVNNPDWYGEFLASFFIGWCWPRIAMATLKLPGTVKPAIGGTSLTTLASTFTTRAAPYIAPASFEPTIYVLSGGHQDYLDNDTGAQVYSDAGALADLARAAGAQYVICTTTICSSAITGTREIARQAGNALILADASNKFDAQVNFEVSGLNDFGNPRSFLFDGVHIYGYPHDPEYGTGRAAAVALPFIEAAVAAVT